MPRGEQARGWPPCGLLTFRLFRSTAKKNLKKRNNFSHFSLHLLDKANDSGLVGRQATTERQGHLSRALWVHNLRTWIRNYQKK
ncbi:hypothetical protein CEXT_807181 [Caerostris extrusa]|uniref:Uncharacterized protein n=1 Tax=Caerostris extrusa TaxID=172846 RepID=A0AAV4RXG0_CAEEX|nr:hypothetical protein CEXT_807181 [Caerostris extrusa]